VAVRQTPDGFQQDIGTLALAKCIAELEAIHPWADTVDVHLFLLGFDAATRLQNRTPDTSPETHAA
jgi:hypothetical protein